jgi:1-acyl-sn-glycerol-3-phosphate acyltransferase
MSQPQNNKAEKRTNFALATLYFLLIVLITIVVGIPCFIISLFQPHGEANYWMIRKWARLILWTCSVKTEINGIENLPADGSFILMSTHKSHFDIPVLVSEVPRQFRIVAKAILFKIPIFGWILSAAGYVRVDRSDPKQAFASLDKAAENVASGMPLLIFPEGTRSPDGALRSFKKGGFVLATKAGAPVVPVIVDGTFHVLPKTSLRVCPGLVTVTFFPPIDTSAYSYENKEELMEAVRLAMSRPGE